MRLCKCAYLSKAADKALFFEPKVLIIFLFDHEIIYCSTHSNELYRIRFRGVLENICCGNLKIRSMDIQEKYIDKYASYLYLSLPGSSVGTHVKRYVLGKATILERLKG